MYKVNAPFSKVLILGNGFDLNLGLETSYVDYVKSDIFKELSNKAQRLHHYLTKKSALQNWIDVEIELKNISKSFEIEIEPDFIALRENLTTYLHAIQGKEFNKNSKAYDFIKNHATKDFIIIDFNYTDTTKRILFELGFSQQAINDILIKVHGCLGNQDIIFGVEDSANIRERDIFLKKSFNPKYKSVDVDKLIRQVEEMHIFGHSLGETDHHYFNSFFGTAGLEGHTTKGKKIVMYYYGQDSYKRLLSELDKMTNKNLTGLRKLNDFIAVNNEPKKK